MKTLSLSLASLFLLAVPATADKAISPALQAVLVRLEAGVATQTFDKADFVELHQRIAKWVEMVRQTNPAGYQQSLIVQNIAKELEAAAMDSTFEVLPPDFVDVRQALINVTLRGALGAAKASAAQGSPGAVSTINDLLEQRLTASKRTAADTANYKAARDFLAGMTGVQQKDPPIIIDEWNALDALIIDQHLKQALTHAQLWTANGRPAPALFTRIDMHVKVRAATAKTYTDISSDQKVLISFVGNLKAVATSGKAKPADFKATKSRVRDMGMRRALADLQSATVGKQFAQTHFDLATSILATMKSTSVDQKLNDSIASEMTKLANLAKTRGLTVKDFEAINRMRAMLLRRTVAAGAQKR